MIAPASSLLKPLLTPASISACCCPRSREPRSRQAALRRRARARRGVFNPPARARVEQMLGLRLPAEADGIARRDRSEEHTSELQSLMRHSYSGSRLKQKTKHYKSP